MIATAVYSILTAHQPLVSLITTRVYPNRIPQNTAFPALSYEILARTPTEVLGMGQIDDEVTLQINVFTNKYAELDAIETALRSALGFQRGLVQNGVKIDYIVPKSATDGPFDTQLRKFSRHISFEVSIHKNHNL